MQATRRLDTLLREYVAIKFDVIVPESSWDSVLDKLNEAESGLKRKDNDVKQLFKKVLVKLGDNATEIQPFVDLIPNEYGLSVVKAGIALVLEYASKESDKKEKIYDAFAEVRDTVADARSFGQSFQANTDVSSRQLKEQKKREEEKHDEAMRRVGEFIMGNRLDANNGLVMVLNERCAAVLATVERLENQLKFRSNGSPPMAVSPGRLLEKFVSAVANGAQTTGVDDLILHPNNDLKSIIARKGHFDVGMQAQAQSLLKNPRFSEWMRCSHSDLLLVDGNSNFPASGNFSALSLLCATLVANMTVTYSDDLVISFFCGFHSACLDPWFGPIGLVRSLILQVLLFLEQEEKRVGYDIRIEKPDAYLDSFLSSRPETVAEVLHCLLQHIPQADLTFYCIIDCVSCFDKDLHGQYNNMKVVVSWLQYMAGEDDSMHVHFKVLLTNPGRSTGRISSLVDTTQHITLTSNPSSIQTISDRSVAAHILSFSAAGSNQKRFEDEWD
ncbi:hypothetical protein CMQ_7224 [Grosmannia clavigera kw1407]|uniref:Uncharacterized protein n=1 Tax=Grosmannia clavigera (strain kw1407 / UAMH 11150) TaxID=655863 RepID=F0XPA5_GROCL|nr:uncharacterized protein CMQ_7224 [Grosmannia clavigera kw1407]EFX00222.1 hypothetical protein CMQ_7224 [Grosmannia clavigera kw1407]